MILNSSIYFLLGLIALYKGGDFVVDGASKLARFFKIPHFIVGLTLLAFGTSAPELVVNIIAILNRDSDIVFGNVLGSNITNIFLILGLTTLFYPIILASQIKNTLKNIIISLATCFILILILYITKNNHTYMLSMFGGTFLLLFFSIYMYWITKDKNRMIVSENESSPRALLKPLFIFVTGLCILPLGGHFIIKAITDIAFKLNIPTAFISLFALAVGTSLPELSTCLNAAAKKQYHLVLGNVIGSNIFNILLILGTCSLINPLHFSVFFFKDLLWVIGGSCLMLVIVKFYHSLDRKLSFLFLVIYMVYLYTLFDRFI